jgi:hypothetical protein
VESENHATLKSLVNGNSNILSMMKGKEVTDRHILHKQITRAEAIQCELIINLNLSLSTADKLKCYRSEILTSPSDH